MKPKQNTNAYTTHVWHLACPTMPLQAKPFRQHSKQTKQNTTRHYKTSQATYESYSIRLDIAQSRQVEKQNTLGPLRGRLGKGEIYNRNAARQTTENIIRIAQNSSVKVVQMVNILILVWLFKAKLTCAKMFMKARPANSHIDRIVGFQFWWETSADFKYVGVIRCAKAIMLIDFHLYLRWFSNSEKN